MNWTINQTVDLSRGYTPVVWPDALMASGDENAHTWRVTVMDGGQPAVLDGYTASGFFVRQDGHTVAVAGTVSGNVISVTLTHSCYAVPGRLGGVLRMQQTGRTVTLASVIFTVKSLISDTLIDAERAYPGLPLLADSLRALEMQVEALASGAPAGSYADLAALAAANPDHSKIYITRDDGAWCYWDGTAFVAGGTYFSDYNRGAFVIATYYSVDWSAKQMRIYGGSSYAMPLVISTPTATIDMAHFDDGLEYVLVDLTLPGASLLGYVVYDRSDGEIKTMNDAGLSAEGVNVYVLGWYHLQQEISHIHGVEVLQGKPAASYISNGGKIRVKPLEATGALLVEMHSINPTPDVYVLGARGSVFSRSFADMAADLGSAAELVSPGELHITVPYRNYLLMDAVTGACRMAGVQNDNEMVLVSNGFAAYAGGILTHLLERGIDGAATGALEPYVDNQPFAAKAKDYSGLFNGKAAVDGFVFFTDQHLADGAEYGGQLGAYMLALKYCYDMVPASFVVSGGDWLTSLDTQEEACFKLGRIKGMLRSMFDRHYMLVGNHDLNYLGTDGSGPNTGLLSDDTVRNLWYQDTGRSYYAFDGLHTRFYALDTGQDWLAHQMTTRAWEQIDWLAEQLLSDDAPHSAILMHIYHVAPGGDPSALAQNLALLTSAYHAKTTVSLNSETYDFSACTGKVEFIMSGHTHSDSASVAGGVPVVESINFTAGDTPSYDLVLVDYDSRKLHLVRVGTGSDRVVDLA